jgi:hypothetical protein
MSLLIAERSTRGETFQEVESRPGTAPHLYPASIFLDRCAHLALGRPIYASANAADAGDIVADDVLPVNLDST